MDAIDRKILGALQQDARLTGQALADAAGTSTASCWRRVKSLEERGILRGAVRLVDAAAVDRGVNVVLNVRLAGRSEENRAAIERFVHAHGEIMECYSMSGEWDYLMRVVVADVAAYERFLMHDLLSKPFVADAASHFALAQIKYSTAVPV